jgi:hypothetical protein
MSGNKQPRLMQACRDCQARTSGWKHYCGGPGTAALGAAHDRRARRAAAELSWPTWSARPRPVSPRQSAVWPQPLAHFGRFLAAWGAKGRTLEPRDTGGSGARSEGRSLSPTPVSNQRPTHHREPTPWPSPRSGCTRPRSSTDIPLLERVARCREPHRELGLLVQHQPAALRDRACAAEYEQTYHQTTRHRDPAAA